MIKNNEIPQLNNRARGWLRHIWDKATTKDDWSIRGDPLPWWDKTSTSPMCAFPRFDLSETSYSLPMMFDQTPAWSEVYARIADELVSRFPTFWGAIDWLTLIGNDPNRENYPPEWQVWMPAHLRGNYDPPGWTGNGTEPWGLQPDPIAADGNLFFRGFFNLLLGTHSYVSNDKKWEKPFDVTGYNNQSFEWDYHSINRFIHDQWTERPQGAHCENTKIWPFCLSAAGLGLQLHDKLYESKSHCVYDEWIEFAKKHFAKRNRSGDLKSFAFYYDPIEKFGYFPDEGLSGYGMLAPLLYLYPQAPEFGLELYQAGINDLGWDDHKKLLVQGFADPRWLCIVLMLAREVGDATTERRLKAFAEKEWGPYFYTDGDRFAWSFGLNEDHPRGQLNSLLILSEIGNPGAWSRVYSGKKVTRRGEPEVVGVSFPDMGLNRAFFDPDKRVLHVSTYAGNKLAEKKSTKWRVKNLANTKSVFVSLDGEEFRNWRSIDDSTIEISCKIKEQDFHIVQEIENPQPFKASETVSAPKLAGVDNSFMSEKPCFTIGHNIGCC